MRSLLLMLAGGQAPLPCQAALVGEADVIGGEVADGVVDGVVAVFIGGGVGAAVHNVVGHGLGGVGHEILADGELRVGRIVVRGAEGVEQLMGIHRRAVDHAGIHAVEVDDLIGRGHGIIPGAGAGDGDRCLIGIEKQEENAVGGIVVGQQAGHVDLGVDELPDGLIRPVVGHHGGGKRGAVAQVGMGLEVGHNVGTFAVGGGHVGGIVGGDAEIGAALRHTGRILGRVRPGIVRIIGKDADDQGAALRGAGAAVGEIRLYRVFGGTAGGEKQG